MATKNKTTATKSGEGIGWFPEDAEINLAKNLLMARMYAMDGNQEAIEFIQNIKVKHIDALIKHGFELMGLKGDSAKANAKELASFWLSEAGLADFNTK